MVGCEENTSSEVSFLSVYGESWCWGVWPWSDWQEDDPWWGHGWSPHQGLQNKTSSPQNEALGPQNRALGVQNRDLGSQNRALGLQNKTWAWAFRTKHWVFKKPPRFFKTEPLSPWAPSTPPTFKPWWKHMLFCVSSARTQLRMWLILSIQHWLQINWLDNP